VAKRVRHYKAAGLSDRWCERSRDEWQALQEGLLRGMWVHYTTDITKVTCPDCFLNIWEYMKVRVSNDS